MSPLELTYLDCDLALQADTEAELVELGLRHANATSMLAMLRLIGSSPRPAPNA